MRFLCKTVASASAIGALIFCLRSAPVFADPLSDALGAFARADYATAFPLFEKLANEKNPEATFWLGSMHFLGWGTARDSEKGLALIRTAANAGVTNAQVVMGDIYDNGYGVTADPVEALTWYKIAIAYASSGSEGAPLQAQARGNTLEIVLPKEQVDQATNRAREWKPAPVEGLTVP